MSTLTVHPLDGSAPFVAWRDGQPLISGEALFAAEEMIGVELGLTPEGPIYVAGWGTIEQAAVLLIDLYPHAGVVGDPSLEPLMQRAAGMV